MFSRPLMLSFCLAATAETPRPVHATLPVRRSTCTTIIALRSLRHATANDQGLGEGLGFPMWSAGEISGEDGCTVHVAIRRRWWMVGLETGPPLGRCTYSPAVLKSLCVADRKCWVSFSSSIHSIHFDLWASWSSWLYFVSIALALPCPS